MQIPSSSSYSSGYVTCRNFLTQRLMRQSAYKCCIPGPLDYVSADEFPWDVACWDEINACVVSFVVLWECIKFGGACSSHIHDLAEDVFVFQYIAHKMMWLSTARNLHIGLKFNSQKVTYHTIWSALCMHTLDAGFMSLSLKMSWWSVLARGTAAAFAFGCAKKKSHYWDTA